VNEQQLCDFIIESINKNRCFATKYHSSAKSTYPNYVVHVVSHLWFMARPSEKTWMEPELLRATRISGSCVDGPNDKENIVDGYVPLRKLYDCSRIH